MTSERAIRNLVLIGFMGTGKSSVGRVAADILRFTFLDTDRVIEARAGSAISEAFALISACGAASGPAGSTGQLRRTGSRP
jgi:cytidylate kinase